MRNTNNFILQILIYYNNLRYFQQTATKIFKDIGKFDIRWLKQCTLFYNSTILSRDRNVLLKQVVKQVVRNCGTASLIKILGKYMTCVKQSYDAKRYTINFEEESKR